MVIEFTRIHQRVIWSCSISDRTGSVNHLLLRKTEKETNQIHSYQRDREKMSGVAIHASSWGAALVRISPYTFSAIGIAISIGVSVLGAAWYKSFSSSPH